MLQARKQLRRFRYIEFELIYITDRILVCRVLLTILSCHCWNIDNFPLLSVRHSSMTMLEVKLWMCSEASAGLSALRCVELIVGPEALDPAVR